MPKISILAIGPSVNKFRLLEFRSRAKLMRLCAKKTMAVKEGINVLTRDGKYVGSVEQMLTSRWGDHTAYFLIWRGLLAKEKRLIAVWWVNEGGENELYLANSCRTVDRLPLYETGRNA